MSTAPMMGGFCFPTTAKVDTPGCTIVDCIVTKILVKLMRDTQLRNPSPPEFLITDVGKGGLKSRTMILVSD